jgi:hypothetical protein
MGSQGATGAPGIAIGNMVTLTATDTPGLYTVTQVE